MAILIGLGITIVVQSSSVVTSALTPLCGIGVLPLFKMLPLTLGANIGTTCTALIASLVSLKMGAVQIALVHLLFNITGILVWFPIPPMRRVPIAGARLLGLYASFYRAFPPLYILFAFVFVPGVLLAVSATFKASVAGGIILLLVLLGAVGTFELAWLKGLPFLAGGTPLCMKALTEEQREEGERALEAANRELMGAAEAPKEDVEV